MVNVDGQALAASIPSSLVIAVFLGFYFILFSIASFNFSLSHCSIPFSTEDIDMAIAAIDPSDIELPSFVSEYPCAQFLVQHQ